MEQKYPATARTQAEHCLFDPRKRISDFEQLMRIGTWMAILFKGLMKLPRGSCRDSRPIPK